MTVFKNLCMLAISSFLILSCNTKNDDLFANPDNEKIESWDGKTKLYVPTKKLTSEPGHHWFAYYDKIECDPTNRYVLCMKTTFEHRSPTPEDVIEIGMVDLHNDCAWIKLGESRAWGWQQGCQLQFVPGSDGEIVWNDKEGERFVCHILNIHTREKRTIPWAIYALSPDGKWAVTVDYRRVNDTRPGYGYAGLSDPYANELAPEKSGIWKINMQTGESELIISLAQVAGLENPYDTQTRDAKHWFNHLLINPDGTRFIFLHRWRYSDEERTAKYKDVGGWGTRMLTASEDGSDIRIIDPYNYTSHFIWRDPQHILAWTNIPGKGDGFFLFEDAVGGNIEQVGEGIMTENGHCTYLPGNQWILNDTYPNTETGLQSVYLYHVATNTRVPLGDFYSPLSRGLEWRCDTHPRSTIDGQYVIVDSPNWEGRQLYMMDIRGIISNTN
ncbi:MAG: hypothetical protein LUG18_09515 [Candidatus Azobacteroides sp.]|nr:hypothetical protein [Candidatus Azobacteroides sp.]